MTYVAGIDPGTSGACAVYCTETKRIINMQDLPIWYQTIGKKKRKRIDAIGLIEMFDFLMLMGVELIVLEAVGQRPRQSGMFAFGYTVGLIFMGIMYSKIMVETVPPQRWKKLMSVPGKCGDNADDIMQRADEIFVEDRGMFRGPKGGRMVDRAEAAMMAKFGADYVLKTMMPLKEDDNAHSVLKELYMKAETGA